MSESITTRTNRLAAAGDAREMRAVLNSMRGDAQAPRDAINTLITAMDNLLAKLDADTGTADSDYASTISTPSALGAMDTKE